MESLKLKIIFLTLFFAGFLFLPKISQATVLSDLANSMQPGEWRELNTNNFNSGQILNAQNSVSILDYTDEAQWDPVQKKIYIIGTATGYGIANQEWIEYSESTNSWTKLTKPSFYIGYHSYDHAALDSSRGHYYVRTAASSNTEVYKYSFSTSQWAKLPDMPYSYSNPSALEYFPEMDRVVYVETFQSKFFMFNPSTNAWTEQAWGVIGAGYDIHNITEYDAVNGVLYFGGGNYNPYEFYKLDRTGKVTKLATPPIPLGISGACTNHTVDPVSGKFLIFKPGGTIYEYDPATNTWGTAGTHPLGSGGQQVAVAAKIPEYGVVMAVSATTDKVYLYKHSSGTPPPSDTQSPTTPSNLSATAISSSQINLSWTASTDNVGVSGYRVERCQGSNCINFSQIATPNTASYNDTGLAANTPYRYQIRATDAAGNLSIYSSIFSATTQTQTLGQINIPLKQWIAIQIPEKGKGVYYGDTIYDGMKHVNAALNPLNGRIYFTGGDYSGPVYGQSYRQETYSLSLVERLNDKPNRNAGWRLEYPYCGPSGQVQPKHPDAHGWTWDSKRNIFWHVPPLDYYSNDNCPGETDSGGSDPGFIRNNLMTFDPAAQKWADRGATGGSINVGRGAVYDPVTDSIIHLIEGEAEIYDITNNRWTKYSLGQNVNGGTIYFNIALSAIDLNRRVVYGIDYNSGRLYQYKIDTHTLEDLGLVPGGPTGFVETYIAYDSISDVLYWFDYPREIFNIYHPNTKAWETNISKQSDIAGVDIRARGLVFDELQNVLVAYGDTASSPQPYFFLYRYGSGSSTPDTIPPASPIGVIVI